MILKTQTSVTQVKPYSCILRYFVEFKRSRLIDCLIKNKKNEMTINNKQIQKLLNKSLIIKKIAVLHCFYYNVQL